MTTLDIRVEAYFTNVSDPTKFVIDINVADDKLNALFDTPYSFPCTIGSPADPFSSIFLTTDDGVAYISGLYAQPMVDYVNGNWGTSYTLGNVYAYLSTTIKNALDLKQDIISTGTSGQYFRGDLTLGTTPTAVSAFTNDAGYLTSAPVTSVAGHAGVVTLGISDIGSLSSILASKTVIYNGSTAVTNPVIVVKSGNTTSGNLVVFLTSDGTSTGAALFPNGIFYMKGEVSDATNSYNYSYTLTNSNRTLTISVMKSAPTGVISLLGLNLLSAPVATPNGTTVSVIAIGN